MHEELPPGWRAMGTAPKDGTWIVGWVQEQPFIPLWEKRVRWIDGAWRMKGVAEPGWPVNAVERWRPCPSQD